VIPFRRKIRPALRPAVAMIELIFAIVVMGLILMSIPEITRQSTQSTFTAYQQEAITTLASHLQTVMSHQWDNENNQTIGYPVLQTASTAIPSCSSNHPIGTSDAEGRYCIDNYGNHRSASSIGVDGDDEYGFDDIDDFDGNVTTLTLYGNEAILTETGEYVDLNITITTQVLYGEDSPRLADGTLSALGQSVTYSNPFDSNSTSTRNIKLISVTLTTNNPAEELAKEMRLSAFMCNLGAPKLYYGQFK